LELDDLERRVGDALRALPEPRAPRTLLPRVMTAVAMRANQPWYRREWIAWPWGWQMASALLLTATLLGVVVLTPHVTDVAAEVLTGVAHEAGARATGDAAFARAVAQAAQILAGVSARVVERALPLVLLMYTACVMLGVALRRVALGEAAS
jgi:hypothetical protein